MRRIRPGSAALAVLGLVALSGCGDNAGAMTTLGSPKVTEASVGPRSALAALVTLPRGYVADERCPPAPFDLTTFLGHWSAVPAVDRALLLNAGFKEGYQATRLSPDGRKRFTVQLFRVATEVKAKRLQEGFWTQDTHTKPFELTGVPGVRTDARVDYDGGTGRYVAVAESTFVVGSLLAELTVRQSAADSALRPDAALISTATRQQYARLVATTKRPSTPN